MSTCSSATQVSSAGAKTFGPMAKALDPMYRDVMKSPPSFRDTAPLAAKERLRDRGVGGHADLAACG